LSLMPLLERAYQPAAGRSLLRLAEIVEAELEWTRPLVAEALAGVAEREGGKVALDLHGLERMARGLRRRVIRQAVAEVRGDLRDFGFEHLRALDELVTERQTGRRLELPGLWADRTAEKVVLGLPGTAGSVDYCLKLAVPGRVAVPEAGIELSSALVPCGQCDTDRRGAMRAQLDAAMVGPELVVRSPRPGDRMAPLGMRGTKKLHDFFVDKKIPRAEREGIPVLTTTDDEIVWIVGHRISERAKVTAGTVFVAEIEARRLR
jgi:tRNA(Ile)-lysidine synthase